MSRDVKSAPPAHETQLSALLTRNLRTKPDALAVTDGNKTLSWRHFVQQVEGFAAQLAAVGVTSGNRVALWLPNGTGYLLAIFAIARRGATAVHINTRFGVAEVGDMLARTGASVLVTRSGFAPVDFLGQLERIDEDQLVALKTVICFGLAPAHVAGRPVLAPVLEGTAEDLSQPEDACLTYTTGGTTARPKLVVHNQRSIARHACDVAAAIGTAEQGAALLAVIPFCGTFGNIAAMAMVAGGGHLVCMDAFDLEAADALIRAHGITHIIGDDRMLGRLASVALNGIGAHRTIRFFGAAVFNPDATESCRQGVAAGLVPRAIYGSSELQALYAIGDPAEGGWGPVTPVSPEAKFEILPSDDADNNGELVLSGPSMFSHYLDSQAAQAAVDGRFRTGDLAEHIGEGFQFHGRAGDMLRLGGFLVNPLEIEAFLQCQPGVAGAQVVGVDAGRGISPFAFVLAKPGAALDEAAILATCRDALARFKVPVRVVTVEAYPTSTGPNGPKIARAELRLQAVAILAQAQHIVETTA